LVDCIDIKVDEGIPVREVNNTESTTKDIDEVEAEQVQESSKEYFEPDEDENIQTDSSQQTTSNFSSIIT
jgi:hypothetical protein